MFQVILVTFRIFVSFAVPQLFGNQNGVTLVITIVTVLLPVFDWVVFSKSGWKHLPSPALCCSGRYKFLTKDDTRSDAKNCPWMAVGAWVPNHTPWKIYPLVI